MEREEGRDGGGVLVLPDVVMHCPETTLSPNLTLTPSFFRCKYLIEKRNK